MTIKEPRGWYVADRLDLLGSILSEIEWEMVGAHFVGDRAEIVRGLAKRLTDLTDPLKGHLPGPEAKDVA